MKKILLFSACYFVFAGCVPLIIGAGVLTGYALSGDSASGNVKAEYRELWDICVATLENMEAQSMSTNESKGLLRANISEYDVDVIW